MAHDKRPRMSTCPICGYTDTAEDPEALQMAIEDHIRMAHNLDPATLGGTDSSVKPVSNATAAEVSGGRTTDTVVPVMPAGTNSGGSGAGTAPVYGVGVTSTEETRRDE